ncbi:MAG: methylmalonyl Co-A mutase-associated GTPase MeaB [Deltaproteobacteria bacterium]|nr:methylmalonyl Co-A mutase-associated GTPase MeaB [Deltaproteobacteria bacterium]
MIDVDDLGRRIVAGERLALARGITLAESTRADDQKRSQALLDVVAAHTGRSVRVGLSGTPGVGKSTFIETLGEHLTGQGKSLAVLAIDPSSPTTGGSILGDKTRMEKLSQNPRAFIRPSPSSGALGGVAAHTREALLLCEAAGFDVVIVETVGVGQSEHAVQSLTDTFVLLVAPGGGDDLQGQKRGILDLVDVVVVNKADGSRALEATQTAGHYENAGHLLHHGKAWLPPVLLCSSTENRGVVDVWTTIEEHRASIASTLADRRAAQAEQWLWRCFEQELLRRGLQDAAVKKAVAAVVVDVRSGRVSPGRAASSLAALVLDRPNPAALG